MQRLSSVLGCLLMVYVGCGCRKAELPQAAAREPLEDYAARVERLEFEYSRMQGQLEQIKAVQEELRQRPTGVALAGEAAAATETGKTVPDLDAIDALVEYRVKQIVDGTFNERIGDRHTIQSIFEEVVEEEITAREERKRREEEVERERRRVVREQEQTEREEREFAVFAEVLGLNERQSLAVREVAEQTREAMRETLREMRGDGGFTPRDYRTAFEMVRSNQTENLRQIMTETQFQAFQEEYDGRLRGAGDRGFRGGRR